MRRIATAAVAASLILSLPALAQSSVPNPLRPKPAELATDSPKARDAKPENGTTADKPRRERSAKQKENDDIMRACGATWRAEKTSLQATGATWRSYLKECRAKRKGEVKALLPREGAAAAS